MTSAAKKIDEEDYEFKEERAELVEGEIVYKALSGGEHAGITYSLGLAIGPFSRRKRNDGTGGWWILSEPTILYRGIRESGQKLIADLAGWRRERCPERPKGCPIQIRPDWVCEVCHSTRKKDTTVVPETLAAEGVPWYWFLDVEAENLMVYELSDAGFVLRMSLFREDGKVRIPPFDAVELSMPVLFGDDPED